MKILFSLALFICTGLFSGCTPSGSASSGSGTPTYTTPSTLEVQSEIQQTHSDRSRVF